MEAERDRDVRGSIASAPWEKNAHAHDEGREAAIMRSRVERDPPKRFGRRETFRPLVMPYGA